MTKYICKCGRSFQKSVSADTTGNRLKDFGPEHECYGCPFILELKEGYPKPFVKGYECRGSKSIRYDSTARLSAGDKSVGKIYSLDFGFLHEIWNFADGLEGILSDRHAFDQRPADYGNDGRYILSIYPAQNKIGVRAKQLLQQKFFNPDGSRKDLPPKQEKELVLKRIAEAKAVAQEQNENEVSKVGKMNLSNISAGLNQVKSITESLANISHYELVPLEFIEPAAHNPFAENDTDESRHDVAVSIQTSGLIEPLAVNKKSPEEYTLISGEHRFTAIKKYLSDRFPKVPCMVFEGLSDDEAELKLYEANSQREYTAEQKFKRYQELDALLHRMKESGTFHGAIQKGIAERLGVSTRQIRKYQTITDLPVEKQQAVINGEISINAACREANIKSEPTYDETDADASESRTGSAFEANTPEDSPAGDDTLPTSKQDVKAENRESLSQDKIKSALKQHFSNKMGKLLLFYLFEVPTTQEAIAKLKPDYGYSYSTVKFDSLSFGDFAMKSTGIEIRYGEAGAKLSYSQVDALIREMIRSGEWIPKEEARVLILKHVNGGSVK